VRYQVEGDSRVARLQEELGCRDEIIVALQHVVRELRHELENLRAEHRYGMYALETAEAIDAGTRKPPRHIADEDISLPLAG
jgi:hypothetical protein